MKIKKSDFNKAVESVIHQQNPSLNQQRKLLNEEIKGLNDFKHIKINPKDAKKLYGKKFLEKIPLYAIRKDALPLKTQIANIENGDAKAFVEKLTRYHEIKREMNNLKAITAQLRADPTIRQEAKKLAERELFKQMRTEAEAKTAVRVDAVTGEQQTINPETGEIIASAKPDSKKNALMEQAVRHIQDGLILADETITPRNIIEDVVKIYDLPRKRVKQMVKTQAKLLGYEGIEHGQIVPQDLMVDKEHFNNFVCNQNILFEIFKIESFYLVQKPNIFLFFVKSRLISILFILIQ